MSVTEQVAKFQFGLYKNQDFCIFWHTRNFSPKQKVEEIMRYLPRNGTLPIYWKEKI